MNSQQFILQSQRTEKAELNRLRCADLHRRKREHRRHAILSVTLVLIILALAMVGTWHIIQGVLS